MWQHPYDDEVANLGVSTRGRRPGRGAKETRR
jgi:hypothetical protein